MDRVWTVRLTEPILSKPARRFARDLTDDCATSVSADRPSSRLADVRRGRFQYTQMVVHEGGNEVLQGSYNSVYKGMGSDVAWS